VDPGSNLDTLMARYQPGDFPAATALIERIGPQLNRFFLAQPGNRADAYDLLQLKRIADSIHPSLRPVRPLPPNWLLTISGVTKQIAARPGLLT
jgi:hypothetical protein